jgi:hypothetical protein
MTSRAWRVTLTREAEAGSGMTDIDPKADIRRR